MKHTVPMNLCVNCHQILAWHSDEEWFECVRLNTIKRVQRDR